MTSISDSGSTGYYRMTTDSCNGTRKKKKMAREIYRPKGFSIGVNEEDEYCESPNGVLVNNCKDTKVNIVYNPTRA
ncbi:hypothetical protein CEXT_384971 [Caerostris extrusa]|uniref:Uncharacterized protein n=1 Tax=Caerostris extrusa TaxID=172846 RepID=A0AAV4M4Z5_CAEEX|nr:hypothetical protein CEXT_384971 [Caerostris extrusa]